MAMERDAAQKTHSDAKPRIVVSVLVCLKRDFKQKNDFCINSQAMSPIPLKHRLQTTNFHRKHNINEFRTRFLRQTTKTYRSFGS